MQNLNKWSDFFRFLTYAMEALAPDSDDIAFFSEVSPEQESSGDSTFLMLLHKTA